MGHSKNKKWFEKSDYDDYGSNKKFRPNKKNKFYNFLNRRNKHKEKNQAKDNLLENKDE